MMTAAHLEDLYGALTEADADGDAEALAKICWQLYSELGEAIMFAGALQARFTAVIGAARAAATGDEPEAGRMHDGSETCPGCGGPDQAASCVFCGQPLDPSCGYGLEYTPASAESPGRWRCVSCRVGIAEEIRVPA